MKFIAIGAMTALSFGFTDVQAWAGPRDSGGGDICQNRIEEIRNNISDWITSGQSAGLDFANSGTSLSKYNQKMQSRIALTRLDDQNSISCTSNPALVQVDGAQKTCVAYLDPRKPRVLCYRGESKDGQFVNGFMGLSEDDQYFQIHHEFAVLSGIEDQQGASTDYPLSRQISGKLTQALVKKLPVLPWSSTPSLGTLRDAIDLGLSQAHLKCTGDFWGVYSNPRRIGFAPLSNLGTVEVQTDLDGGFFSVKAESPLQIFVANYVSGHFNVPFPSTPSLGDMVSQVTISFSPDNKSVTSVDLKMFVYENVGTLVNPIAGLPAQPNYQATCHP